MEELDQLSPSFVNVPLPCRHDVGKGCVCDIGREGQSACVTALRDGCKTMLLLSSRVLFSRGAK